MCRGVLVSTEPYARIHNIPRNETRRHWALKWAAWWILMKEFECRNAALEVSARMGPGAEDDQTVAEHDAVGLRRVYKYREHPWQTVPCDQVAVNVSRYDPKAPGQNRWKTGAWVAAGERRLAPGELPGRDEPDAMTSYYWEPPGGRQVHIWNRDIRPARKSGMVQIREPGTTRETQWLFYGVDAKQSRSDYQKWLREWEARVAGMDYFLIVAPAGLLQLKEIPPKIGLVEVDLARLVTIDRYDGQEEDRAPWIRVNYTVVRQPTRLRKYQDPGPGALYDFASRCAWRMKDMFLDNLGAFFWSQLQAELAAAGENEPEPAESIITRVITEPPAAGAPENGLFVILSPPGRDGRRTRLEHQGRVITGTAEALAAARGALGCSSWEVCPCVPEPGDDPLDIAEVLGSSLSHV